MKFSTVRSLNGGALIALLASFVVLLLIVHFSTPTGSGPIGILAVFTLVYVFFTSSILIATGAYSLVMSRLMGHNGMTDRRRYYISSVLGFLPVLYLTLLSMGGASVWGVLLIFLFIALMLFYVLRRSA